MTIPTPITNYAEIMFSRLMEQYKDAPNIKGIMSIYATQLDEMELVCQELMNLRVNIELATGRQLDHIGDIVAIKRLGLLDDDYRQLIYGKIGVNSSEGTPNQVIDIALLLTGTNSVRYINLGQASFEMDFSEIIPDVQLERLLFYLVRSVAAGVKINSIKMADDDEAFMFSSPRNLGQGFAVGKFPVVKNVPSYEVQRVIFGDVLKYKHIDEENL